MNNKNVVEEITILKTWKWETFEINVPYEQFIIQEKIDRWNWLDGFDSAKYRRYIKYASIEDKIWKTKHLALPEPEKEYKEPTDEERATFKKWQNEFRVKTFETRKKKFRIERDRILHNLQKEEKEFWLETVLNKLTELDNRRIKEQKTLLLKK